MKKIITVAIAICILVFVGVGVTLMINNRSSEEDYYNDENLTNLYDAFSYNGEEDFSDLMRKLGQIEREGLDARRNSCQEDNIYMRGDDFIIYESDIAVIDNRYRLNDIEDGRERAIRFLLREAILYSEASKRGYYADDQEVRDMINRQIEDVRAAENLDEFYWFLEPLEMTIEEYWESQYDTIRKNIVRNKFLEPKRAAFRAVNDGSAEDDWFAYLDKFVEQSIEARNLQ